MTVAMERGGLKSLHAYAVGKPQLHRCVCVYGRSGFL
jgi:hypothetical protein